MRNMRKKLLGVLGGMGTQATACFYEKLHDLQSVASEQDYLDVIVYSKPSIPDRTAFIIGQSTEDPLEALLHAAKTLEAAGASCIAIPCVTAHFFYADIKKKVSVPVLNMPEETARFVEESGLQKIGLLATDGTLKGKVFHTAFEETDIEMILPSPGSQADLMEIIYDVKRGAVMEPEFLDAIAAELRDKGAQVLVLGCTELCYIEKDCPDYINTLDVLARASLISCME